MTFRPTPRQQELLDCVSRHGRINGIYRLSQLLGRPYRRVLDQAKALEREGLIRLSFDVNGGRRQTVIEPASGGAATSQPELHHPRIWSSPVTGVDDHTLIASVLAEPTFDDLLRCVLHYGLEKVRSVYRRMLASDHFEPWAQQEAARMLDNIEIGFARAA